jgi:rhodanese-related sulfurtransferase
MKMFYSTIFGIGFLLVFLYTRYFPVKGVKCCQLSNLEGIGIQIVDVRDYNYSYKDPILRAINIPVAYLKRNYHEIPRISVHIVAADPLEKNVSIRFLRKHGFKVAGYTLTDCKCHEKLDQKTA